MNSFRIFIVLLFLCFSALVTAQTAPAKPKWFKGNTHTHTLNSDGDSTPDVVAAWYRDHGYNFLVMTDHEFITPVEPLNQKFAKAGEFVVISGQEVTDLLDRKPYHVNALGITSVTKPKNGKTVVENLQLNVDAIRALGGVPQINHPNFGWALTADQIRQVKNARLLDIYNGHPLVNNLGGGGSPSTEQIWDAVLSSGTLMFGVAVDDSHSFTKLGEKAYATPGHGWVMVRSAELTSRAILEALDRGDFYSSSGVELEDYATDSRSISISVKAQRGSKYRIQFIGRNGVVLQESQEPKATYSAKGNEGYVRVKVIESNGKMVWTQPVMLK